MPKNKKRRKLNSVSSLANLHHLTGFDGGDGQETSLAECMVEFSQPSVESGEKSDGQNQTEKDLEAAIEKWEGEHVDSDRLESWNRSFLTWTRGGNYEPSLLPSIDEELARHFQVQELSKSLLKHGEDLRMPVFERWLLDARIEDDSSPDPVLPVSLNMTSGACQRLVEELTQSGLDRKNAEVVTDALRRKANVAGQELASQAGRYKRSSPLKKGDRMELEDHGSSISLVYARKKWKKPFCFPLNKTHYEKIKMLFFKTHRKCVTKLDGESKGVLMGFHVLVVSMILRYSSMSGGQLLQDLRGGGMQGAIHDEVFEVLRTTWECPLIEGFASPFNVCMPVFGSAFPDLDWHFGSIGNFLAQSFIRKGGCCCEVNPPFSPAIMAKMADHVDDQLRKADRAAASMTFVIVVPTARSGKQGAVQRSAFASFNQMVGGDFCRMQLQLAARDHGYLEGSQHLRPTRYKQSSYDTSVIVLQSKKAREENIDESNFEKRIRTAFASQHELELKKRIRSSGDN